MAPFDRGNRTACMSRSARSEARASMGGTLPNTAIISRSPSPSRPKLGRYARYRDGLGRARAKIAETAQVWNIRPRANSTLDNDRIIGRVPRLQVGKQVPAGRGKAIAATSKGGPPTAVAFGKGACHVRSPIRSSKFAVPIEEIRESERSRSLLRPSKSGRSGHQEPDLGCPPSGSSKQPSRASSCHVLSRRSPRQRLKRIKAWRRGAR